MELDTEHDTFLPEKPGQNVELCDCSPYKRYGEQHVDTATV